MKLRKLILPAILALGAVGGFAAAKLSDRGFAQARALDGYDGDVDIDVGLHISPSTKAAADWTVSQFYIDALDSRDASSGDYIAIRMQCAEGAGSWYDIGVNLSGVSRRVNDTGTAFGLKFVPAGPHGVAFDHAGFRNNDIPLNIWSGSDGYVCIPKTGFSKMHFGETYDWNNNVSAIYFMFYGTTIDKINFDIGDIFTANISASGHLVKVNTLFSWSQHSGSPETVCNDCGNLERLDLARNNSSLVPGAAFVKAIENVDTCNETAAENAYDNNIVAYTALSNANKAYLEEAIIGDYADGDTTHAGDRSTGYTAAQKWAAICEAAGHGSSSRVVLFNDQNKAWLYVIIASVSTLSLPGVFFIIRRRRVTSKQYKILTIKGGFGHLFF